MMVNLGSEFSYQGNFFLNSFILLQPNEYMDNLLENARATMRERGLNSVKLPDQNQGVALYNGKMTGLDNLTRSGDALLEADSDHFLLSFAIEANNIKANYWWKKQRLK